MIHGHPWKIPITAPRKNSILLLWKEQKSGTQSSRRTSVQLLHFVLAPNHSTSLPAPLLVKLCTAFEHGTNNETNERFGGWNHKQEIERKKSLPPRLWTIFEWGDQKLATVVIGRGDFYWLAYRIAFHFGDKRKMRDACVCVYVVARVLRANRNVKAGGIGIKILWELRWEQQELVPGEIWNSGEFSNLKTWWMKRAQNWGEGIKPLEAAGKL